MRLCLAEAEAQGRWREGRAPCHLWLELNYNPNITAGRHSDQAGGKAEPEHKNEIAAFFFSHFDSDHVDFYQRDPD